MGAPVVELRPQAHSAIASTSCASAELAWLSNGSAKNCVLLVVGGMVRNAISRDHIGGVVQGNNSLGSGPQNGIGCYMKTQVRPNKRHGGDWLSGVLFWVPYPE